MKNVALLLIGLFFSSYCIAGTADTIAANNSLIEYTGRIDFANPKAPKFSYSGVSVRASFSGTSIAVMLNDEGNQNYYNVIIDHSVYTKIQTIGGLKTYQIASNLTDTIHEIELFKISEMQFGKTQFYGFLVDKDKTLVDISNKREHLIEYIGNSITCGYGNEGALGGVFGPTTENHYLTYAAFTSRSFNARHLAVCRSGIGIYRNYDGPIDGSADCMTNNYQRIFLYDQSPLYTFATKPNLICIDLGTNDFSTSKGDSGRYVRKYLQFIDTLQLKNKGVDILCLLGPMLSGADLVKVRNCLHAVVDSANKKNNGMVYFFEMSQQTGNYGIDYHPTVVQHLKNSKELTAYISTLKNWNIQPYTISASAKKANEIVISFNTEMQAAVDKISGFSASENGINIPLTSMYVDSTDKSIIHLVTTNKLSANSTLLVSYSSESVVTVKNIKLNSFKNTLVINSLVETKLNKALIDKSGYRLTLTFNKDIIKPTDFSGISVYTKTNNAFSVDSIKLLGSSIYMYLNNKIIKADSVFVSIKSGISGLDNVAITPTTRFIATNSSLYTTVNVNNQLKCTIYPNPVTNGIIEYNIEESVDKLNCQLVNMKGDVVYSSLLKASHGVINLNNAMLHGNYVLKLYSSSKSITKIMQF